MDSNPCIDHRGVDACRDDSRYKTGDKQGPDGLFGDNPVNDEDDAGWYEGCKGSASSHHTRRQPGVVTIFLHLRNGYPPHDGR